MGTLMPISGASTARRGLSVSEDNNSSMIPIPRPKEDRGVFGRLGWGRRADVNLPAWWAKYYNAEHAGSSNPADVLAAKESQFMQAARRDVLPEVRESAAAAFGSGAFDYELGKLDLTRDQAANYLSEISKVESSGGLDNTISTGGAAGYFQVVPSTFRSLIENEGVIGRKALAYLGKTKDELLGMSNQEIQNYLQKDQTAGATFGAAALVSKLAAAQRTLFP